MTTKAAVLKAIRAKWLDCSCHQVKEVELCTVCNCDLWPFRFARYPNPGRARGAAKRASGGAIFDEKEMPGHCSRGKVSRRDDETQ